MRGRALIILLCVSLVIPVFSISCEVNMENNANIQSTTPTVWTKTPFPELEFHNDYLADTLDVNGNYMGGTECLFLVGHKGMLFAGIGYWNDIPGDDPKLGAQVLRKETTNGPWIVEQSWSNDFLRINAMESVTFTTDGNGKKLKTPVNLLLCAPGKTSPSAGDQDISVWVRDDTTQQWQESYIATMQNAPLAYARAISLVYRDKVTGVECVFAGTSKGYGADEGGIYRGVYDASANGDLRWDAGYEFAGPGRFGAFAEVNGRLYASQQENQQNPAAAGLYVRNDGENPTWERIYHLPADSPNFKYSLMRGLTAVDDPEGGEYQLLLGAWDNSGGLIQRIDPMKDNATTTEIDVKQYFNDEWGGIYINTFFAAYNHITPVKHPLTGETVHLLGLMAFHPDPELRLSSWYFVRYRDGSYDLARIWAPDYIMSEEMKKATACGLRGARTTIVSPFAEDKGEVFYFGGFDSWTVGHNTAWIFKATVKKQT